MIAKHLRFNSVPIFKVNTEEIWLKKIKKDWNKQAPDKALLLTEKYWYFSDFFMKTYVSDTH